MILKFRILLITLTLPCLLVLTGCPLKNQTNTVVSNINNSSATIGTPFSLNVSVTTRFTLTVTPPAGSWLSYTRASATSGTLSGTPKGHDFGGWPVNIRIYDTKRGGTARVTATVTVNDPTLASFTPTAGFVVPLHSQEDVTINISPAKAEYTCDLEHEFTDPTDAKISIPPNIVTDSAGTGTITLVWQSGGDFKGQLWLHLKSDAPGGRKLKLGPIPSKSE